MARHVAVWFAMLAAGMFALSAAEPQSPCVAADFPPAVVKTSDTEHDYVRSFWSLSRVREDTLPRIESFRTDPPPTGQVLIFPAGHAPYAWTPFVRESSSERRQWTADDDNPSEAAYLPESITGIGTRLYEPLPVPGPVDRRLQIAFRDLLDEWSDGVGPTVCQR